MSQHLMLYIWAFLMQRIKKWFCLKTPSEFMGSVNDYSLSPSDIQRAAGAHTGDSDTRRLDRVHYPTNWPETAQPLACKLPK